MSRDPPLPPRPRKKDQCALLKKHRWVHSRGRSREIDLVWGSFGTIFEHIPHVKIFLILCRYLLALLCPWLKMTFTHNLTNFCNVFFSSAHCWPSWSLFITDTFTSLSKCVTTCKFVFFIALSLQTYTNISLISLPLLPHVSRNLMSIHCSDSSSDLIARAHQNTLRKRLPYINNIALKRWYSNVIEPNSGFGGEFANSASLLCVCVYVYTHTLVCHMYIRIRIS
jgi:hypothetical protein